MFQRYELGRRTCQILVRHRLDHNPGLRCAKYAADVANGIARNGQPRCKHFSYLGGRRPAGRESLSIEEDACVGAAKEPWDCIAFRRAVHELAVHARGRQYAFDGAGTLFGDDQ